MGCGELGASLVPKWLPSLARLRSPRSPDQWEFGLMISAREVWRFGSTAGEVPGGPEAETLGVRQAFQSTVASAEWIVGLQFRHHAPKRLLSWYRCSGSNAPAIPPSTPRQTLLLGPSMTEGFPDSRLPRCGRKGLRGCYTQTGITRKIAARSGKKSPVPR